MNTKNDVNTTVGALLKGMDSFITTKTVVGDPQQVGDTIILPLIDASFGVGAGAFCDDKKNNGAGGMSGKISPSAVLVIRNDMVPGIVDKFSNKVSTKAGKNEAPVEEVKTATEEI